MSSKMCGIIHIIYDIIVCFSDQGDKLFSALITALHTFHHKCVASSALFSGGSRISRRGGGVDLVGGGVDSRGSYISKFLYVKTKELGPLGGARAGRGPLDPPMLFMTLLWGFFFRQRGIGLATPHRSLSLISQR